MRLVAPRQLFGVCDSVDLMSAQHPPNTKPLEHRPLDTKDVKPRLHRTAVEVLPAPFPVLPPPSASEDQRPRLPPISHLNSIIPPPPPRARPSELESRASQSVFGLQHYSSSPSSHSTSWTTLNSPYYESRGPAPSISSARLRTMPNQTSCPETVYEPLSPRGHCFHEQPGRSSIFDDSTYPASTYHGGHGSYQSPASSHHSSTTSSIGQTSGKSQYTQSAASLRQPASMFEGDSSEHDMKGRYRLQVRQQPQAARACGFGERDRRVIDPPAIVQLSFKDFDPDSSEDVAQLQYPFHIVHCSLITPEEPQAGSDVTSVPDPSKINAMSRRLMGTLVASPFVAVDPEAAATSSSSNINARLGCFFIFPDLSVRQTGRYRLRFTLMKVSMQMTPEGSQGNVIQSVDSEPFEVFIASNFPGMSASSTLIRELKRQGAPVSLKKGAGPGKQKRSGNVTEKSESEDSAGTENSTRKARQKKKRV